MSIQTAEPASDTARDTGEAAPGSKTGPAKLTVWGGVVAASIAAWLVIGAGISQAVGA